jgi:hypothetical protein
MSENEINKKFPFKVFSYRGYEGNEITYNDILLNNSLENKKDINNNNDLYKVY